MSLVISSYPPLAKETVIKNSRVFFNVCVEDQSWNEDWEVEIWHQLPHGVSWVNLRLERTNACDTIPASERPCGWYSATLNAGTNAQRPLLFTIRFRPHADSPWQWVRDRTGSDDGQLLFLASCSYKSELDEYFADVTQFVDVDRIASETPNTALWQISGDVRTAHVDQPGEARFSLGTPRSCVRWFCLVRHTVSWLGPRHGTQTQFTSEPALCYGFLRDDGNVLVVLAVSGVRGVDSVLESRGDRIEVAARNDFLEPAKLSVLVSIGKSFDAALAATLYRARHLVGNNEEQPFDSGHANLTREWHDGLTFCTWNSLGFNVSEDGIRDCLTSLRSQNVFINTLIIDDGWQDVDDQNRWRSFKAVRNRFPNGLEGAFRNMKREFPYIKHCAIWHAFLGHWEGIAPDSELSARFHTREVTVRAHGMDSSESKKLLVIDHDDIDRFTTEFYSYLQTAGIDSVKVDVQSALDRLKSATDRRDLIRSYQSAWNHARQSFFGGRAVSCMSQTPQNVFALQLPFHSWKLPTRNSDDFFPNEPASHPWHIFCNAHNSLFSRYLNVFPDWDMFQTDHPWGSYHAAARCLSGGPITITDRLGEHDDGVLGLISANTVSGKTITLRPSVPGHSGTVFTSIHDSSLCRIVSFHGGAGSGHSFMGLFNTKADQMTEIVSLSDFIGIEPGAMYVIYSHQTRALSRPMTLTQDPAMTKVSVGSFSWDVLTALPVDKVHYRRSETKQTPLTVEVAALGLVKPVTGVVAQLECSVEICPGTAETSLYMHGRHTASSPLAAQALSRLQSQSPSDPCLHVKLVQRALGLWALWFDPHDRTVVLEKNVLVILQGMPVPLDTVALVEANSRPQTQGHVAPSCGYLLTVQLDRAWADLQLRAGPTDEFSLQVLVTLSSRIRRSRPA